MKLSDLHTGERGVIVKVFGHGGFRKRIVEMGFVKGKTVEVILNAPLKDPIEYEIMGYKISLRREEAKLVEVLSEKEAESDVRLNPDEFQCRLSVDVDEQEEAKLRLKQRMEQLATSKHREIRVALVGNPNCGKTSLFNMASGGHEHVGNYGGVTIDAKEGSFKMKIRARDEDEHAQEVAPQNEPICNCPGCTVSNCAGKEHLGQLREYTFKLVDLPGTYSLTAYSPEELYVRRHLTEEMPDVVVNVIDSSNLERNLYLTTQLVDMHLRVVCALNMHDELEASGDELDEKQLGHLFGVPMVPTVSRTGQGIRQLFETVVAVYENPDAPELARHIHVNHGRVLEESIDRLKRLFQKNQEIRTRFSTRYLAIKFLEGDAEVNKLVETLPEHDELIYVRFDETARIRKELHDTPDNALTDAKYGFIQGALKETFRPHTKREGKTLTERIDAFVTSRWLGFPIFIVLLFSIFQCTFSLGQYPMDWIDWLVAEISDFVNFAMPEGMLRDLIVDGAISGVGSVIVFLPNILILYLFLSFLEDTGYMARAAFIMDKVMHKMGLHGKSFIPMVMGFGCNVPAVMATRTIENPKSRLVTMLITPFMSCSARIPVYVVLISAFFPQQGGLLMLGLYALGILASAVMARLFSKFLFKGENLPFVMELPPYRMPTMKSVVRHTWEKGRQYLHKMGGIILVASVIVWALGYFPAGSSPTSEETEAEASYLERIGRLMTPVTSPMDFDWKMDVGILAGLGAKELVVSSLAVVYTGEEVETDGAEDDGHLIAALRNNMSTESALAYLVFILFYFPCFATIAAIKNESGGWKWALFAAVYTTVFAYIASLATYWIACAF